jgi:hypothetical protein
MSQISGIVGSIPGPNIEDTLSAVMRPPRSGGRFRGIAGAVVGSVANIAMPGLGGVIGQLISGKPGTGTLLGSDTWQYIQYQQQMTTEMRQFELVSTIMKSRHDSAMSAIRNMKSS